MNMYLKAGEEITFEKARIKVIGLAKLGRGETSRIDGPGSFSIPKHEMPGVYAGVATHGLMGKEFTNPLPVLMYCNEEHQMLSVQANNILGTWLACEVFSSVNISHGQEYSSQAA